ncbi:hypothetical protein EH245_07495 [Bifidobacterium breve]|nr:hypothetical protein EH245_07495 [Bifidobacterium breve]
MRLLFCNHRFTCWRRFGFLGLPSVCRHRQLVLQLWTGLARDLLARLSSRLRLQTARWAVCFRLSLQRGARETLTRET